MKKTSFLTLDKAREIIREIPTPFHIYDEAGIRASIEDMNASHAQLVGARARSGLVLSKLDASETVLSALDTEQNRRAQQAGAADPFESYSRVTVLGQSLERAIAVSRQILDIGGGNRF